MKNTLHRSFAMIMLIGFLYVQVPFAAFHHHDHEPVCELNDHTDGHEATGETQKHFHETEEHSACFMCSAQLIKEYQVKDHTFSFAITFVTTPFSHSDQQLSSSFHCSTSARAPPVLA